jgi:hypothetical protein
MINPFAGLGKPRRMGDRVCSLCEDDIPYSHKPLQLRASGRALAWLYCIECEPIVRDAYKAAKTAGVP